MMSLQLTTQWLLTLAPAVADAMPLHGIRLELLCRIAVEQILHVSASIDGWAVEDRVCADACRQRST